MSIVRVLAVVGLLGVALIGVPGARADEGAPSDGSQVTDDEDAVVAGGGACAGGEAEGLFPFALAVAGTALRRRKPRT